ncbi:inactive rhomboid protein 1-like isoform X2 [Paramacrobiotus metropolitanus]|uniref:inactive rhomboid protein 1-like isoform X2 n=1 Tax=Paramacrobiotus metropolitanus TaxID=2943436 RepID=UPI00244655B9|nr:inactive rhomboid protein 1-like isoform X2 [Paramacrobiotus metropolitanus]
MDPDMDNNGDVHPNLSPMPTASASGGSSRSVNEPKTKRSSFQNLTRMTSLRRSLSSGVKRSQGAVAQFLGVQHIPEEQQDERKAMWEVRRAQLGRRLGAKPKSPVRLAVQGPDNIDGQVGPTITSDDERIRNALRAFRKPSAVEMAWKRISRKARERPEVEGMGPSSMVTTPMPSTGRPTFGTMASFPGQRIDEIPELRELEPADVTIRHEKFFDQATGPVEELSGEFRFTPFAVHAAPSPPKEEPAHAPPTEATTLLKGKALARARDLRVAISAPQPPLAPIAKPETAEITDGTTDTAKKMLGVPAPGREKSRFFGMSILLRCCMRPFRKDLDKATQEQLYELLDHRPYFTYWVTVAQILILVVSVAVYGFAPVGFDSKQHSSLILETSLALETVDYYEPENFWLGPRAAHLIHLGAKYAPCMRPDDEINKKIAFHREQENQTACCISNDKSGCVQSTKNKCSSTMATFAKWPDTDSSGRVSGSVCGLDPRYCADPPSTGSQKWPDDITKWPICKKQIDNTSKIAWPQHMQCEVVGHPCCIDTQGGCRITTREYCDFVQGYFHETALLCSQVSCLDKICGMLPFFDPEVPDQFYRLWTAIFLHAGFVHLAITILFQYYIMRDTEKLTGCIRMAIIYIMSGVAGNLASAIFTPYVAEVGPSGSQFGVFACVIVEIIYSWKLVDKPWVPLLKMLLIALFLFIIGLFPWTDNYSHIFGFIFGFLLSLALLPYIAFSERERKIKVWIIVISVLVATGLFAVLIVLFYIHPIYNCEVCSYFNCIPWTSTFCDYQKIIIKDKEDRFNTRENLIKLVTASP